ncbi:tautomerase family protein [Pseudomonas sp. PLMAX]|uniref:tautomerase family protein n=1 Tax=Pseudomonas sp. PLMAX TaxID=2201998 RepID=UPI0038B80AE8
MPIVRVEDPVSRDADTQHAVIETIYGCLKSVFKVSDEELQARYVCYDKEHIRSPGDRSEFIQIEITVFKGRHLETKRQLYQSISKSIAALLNISEHAPLILLLEQEPENWGMRGGVPASEIDFGYAISI